MLNLVQPETVTTRQQKMLIKATIEKEATIKRQKVIIRKQLKQKLLQQNHKKKKLIRYN
jgi:hypothetical protein